MPPEHTKEIRAYQKKIGDILSSAFADLLKADEDKVKSAEKIRKASAQIKEKASKLTPPSFAQNDDDILFAGCNVLLEGADIYEKMADDDFDEVYFKSLIMLFETCAKNCAGEYYGK